MAKFQPDGWHTITPRIIVRDPENLIAFLKTVFGAQGELQPGRHALWRPPSDGPTSVGKHMADCHQSSML
jgi:hypothetical protein